MVTEAVPGLINHRQRAQLILGLRARVSRTCSLCNLQIRTFCCYLQNMLIFQLILELCKGSVQGYVDSQVIQSYLERLPLTSTNTDVSTLNKHFFKTKSKVVLILHGSFSDMHLILVSTGMQR